eukprot:scaffold9.g3231.t1
MFATSQSGRQPSSTEDAGSNTSSAGRHGSGFRVLNGTIKVFYHVFAGDDRGWKEVMRDQLSKILFSRLYAAAEGVYVFAAGGAAAEAAALAERFGRRVRAVAAVPTDASHERLTLRGMRRLLRPGDVALYLHSKGVTHAGTPAEEAVRDWRMAMEFALVAGWVQAVRLLEEGRTDVVGINYLGKPAPHFSGNFWWTTADWFLSLPAEIGDSYLDPEMYILAGGRARWHSLLTSAPLAAHGRWEDEYTQPYPPREYVD